MNLSQQSTLITRALTHAREAYALAGVRVWQAEDDFDAWEQAHPWPDDSLLPEPRAEQAPAAVEDLSYEEDVIDGDFV